MPKVGFRIERAYLHSELAPTFDRLFDLGRGDEKIFALRASELQVAEQQRMLLDRNRDLSIELVAEVEGLVNTARGSAPGGHANLHPSHLHRPQAPARD